MSDQDEHYSKAFEGCRKCQLDSHQRVVDAGMYSAPFNLAQLTENAYAVMNDFNATCCTISVVDNVENFVRPIGHTGAVRLPCKLAFQVHDTGRGIPHHFIDIVMRYGYRGFMDCKKKLGVFNCSQQDEPAQAPTATVTVCWNVQV